MTLDEFKNSLADKTNYDDSSFNESLKNAIIVSAKNKENIGFNELYFIFLSLADNNLRINNENLTTLVNYLNKDSAENINNIRPMAISNIINSLSKIKCNARILDNINFANIEKVINLQMSSALSNEETLVEKITPTNITNYINGLRKIKKHPTEELDVKKMIKCFITKLYVEKKPTISIEHFLNSLAEFEYNAEDFFTKKDFERMEYIVYKNKNPIKPQDVATLILAIKKFNLKSDHDFFNFKVKNENKNFISFLIEKLKEIDFEKIKNSESETIMNSLNVIDFKSNDTKLFELFLNLLKKAFDENYRIENKARIVANILNAITQIFPKENIHGLENMDGYIKFVNDNIDSFSEIDISNFFNGFSKTGWINGGENNNTFISEKVYNNFLQNIDNFDLEKIAIILNAFKKMKVQNNCFAKNNNENGITKIAGTFAKKLSDKEVNTETLGKISLFLNGLSYFNYRSQDNYIKNIIENIFLPNLKSTLENASNSEIKRIITIFCNGLSTIGFSYNFNDKNIQDLIDIVKTKIDIFDFKEVFSIFDSFIKIFLHNEAKIKNNYEYLKDLMQSLLDKINAKITSKEMKDTSIATLIRSLYFLKKVNNLNDLNIGNNIKNLLSGKKYENEIPYPSSFETLFRRILSSNNKIVFKKEAEISDELSDNIKVYLYVDFYLKNTDGKEYFIELDGKSHYNEATDENTPATQIRNSIIKHIIDTNYNGFNFLTITSKFFNENEDISSEKIAYKIRCDNFLKRISGLTGNNHGGEQNFEQNFEAVEKPKIQSQKIKEKNTIVMREKIENEEFTIEIPEDTKEDSILIELPEEENVIELSEENNENINQTKKENTNTLVDKNKLDRKRSKSLSF